MRSKYPSDDEAGVLEEVDGGGEIEGIGEASQAQSKDKEVQKTEKALSTWSKHLNVEGYF